MSVSTAAQLANLGPKLTSTRPDAWLFPGDYPPVTAEERLLFNQITRSWAQSWAPLQDMNQVGNRRDKPARDTTCHRACAAS